MKYTIVLLVLVFVLGSCSENEILTAKETYIKGNVQVTDSLELDKITLYGYDIFEKQSIQKDIAINENGDFETVIDLKYASEFTLYGINSFSILAVPGDTITANFLESRKAADFEDNLQFTGRTATTQESLQDYLINNPIDTDEFFVNESDKDYKDLEEYLGNQKDALKKHYKKFQDDPSINKYLRDYINADEKYALHNIKMEYAAFARYYGKELPAINGDYYSSINNLPRLDREDLVNSSTISNLLHHHYTFAYQEIEKKSPEATSSEIDQVIIENALDKDTFLNQHTIAMLVMEDLKNHSLQLYEKNSERLKPYFENSTLGISLQERYEEERKLLDNPDLPKETELLTFKTDDPSKYLDEIISNANGKVIYIDNWATWCSPCKAEFKEASPALHEKFKEDVEFIYLCHASDKKAYLPSISQYQIKGKHYFLNDKEGAIIQDQIHLEGFPTYTIIDKNGNQVLSDYIHRPSYNKTTEILKNLIQGNEVNLNDESK